MRAHHYLDYQYMRLNPMYITSNPLGVRFMYGKIHSRNKIYMINGQACRQLDSYCVIHHSMHQTNHLSSTNIRGVYTPNFTVFMTMNLNPLSMMTNPGHCGISRSGYIVNILEVMRRSCKPPLKKLSYSLKLLMLPSDLFSRV